MTTGIKYLLLFVTMPIWLPLLGIVMLMMVTTLMSVVLALL